jgi:hypothetical protein
MTKILQKLILILSICFFVSACATTLKIEKALDVETKKRLQIFDVSVTAAHSIASTTSDTLLNSLKTAVLSELNSAKAQGIPAVMEIVVTKSKIVTRGKRALIGAFAGSNLLDITATIKAMETKDILGVYEVKGDYNPGGYGLFSDPIEATTSSVAEELMKGIYQ